MPLLSFNAKIGRFAVAELPTADSFGIKRNTDTERVGIPTCMAFVLVSFWHFGGLRPDRNSVILIGNSAIF